jgi:hypothetical protein
MKRVIRKKEAKVEREEHELLQQENFEWLANCPEELSPYWSAHLEYQTSCRLTVS